MSQSYKDFTMKKFNFLKNFFLIEVADIFSICFGKLT